MVELRFTLMPYKDAAARKAYLKEYYKRNKETTHKNSDGSWKKSEKRSEYSKEYYQRNKDKWSNSWEKMKNDPEKHAAYNKKRSENKTGGKSYRTTRQKILEELGGKCVICGTTENLEINHRDLKDTAERRESGNRKRCGVSLTEVRNNSVDVELLCKEHHLQWSNAQRKAAMILFAALTKEEQIKLTRELLDWGD